jgi:predicted Zn-dependent protease
MGNDRTRAAILQVRDEARRRGISAFFTLHREKSHLMRIGNNSVSLNTSEDLTRLDVEVLDGRREGAYTVMGDIDTPETVRQALATAVEKARVAMPKDYDPIEPVVQAQVEEDGQYDEKLDSLNPAVKAQTYARIMEAAGSSFNFSGSWSSGSTELFLTGTASGNQAWRLGTDQQFTCVLKHPEKKWELASNQTGWQAGQVTVERAVGDFTALLPVYEQDGFRVEPGDYTVIFGAHAIAELLGMAVWTGFMGRGYEEKMGWTSGNNLGDGILSHAVTLTDDPTDPDTFRYGFDGAGMVRTPFPLVDQGKLAGLMYDLSTAAKYGKAPTAHHGASGLVMQAGNGPADPLAAVRDMGKVLYIPALHYMNIPNRSKGIVTASSRFSAVLVEDGRITRPIFSSRVTDTFRKIFGNVAVLAPVRESVNLSNTYGRRMPEAASVPAYMVSTEVAITDCAESF